MEMHMSLEYNKKSETKRPLKATYIIIVVQKTPDELLKPVVMNMIRKLSAQGEL